MKKSTKILLRVMPIAMGAFVFAGSVFGVSPSIPTTSGSEISGITNLAGSLWKTIAVILQILAIAAIIIAGVRYMFASANTKADIKQQTIILVAGAILVFAAVPIAGFIGNIANNTLNH